MNYTFVSSSIKFTSYIIPGEPRSIAEHIADLPMLLRHLWRYFWSGDGIRLLFRLRIVMFLGMAVFYVLFPFDLLPEVVFGIFGRYYFYNLRIFIQCILKVEFYGLNLKIYFISGLLDDLIVFVLILMYVVVVFRNVISQTGIGAE